MYEYNEYLFSVEPIFGEMPTKNMAYDDEYILYKYINVYI